MKPNAAREGGGVLEDGRLPSPRRSRRLEIGMLAVGLFCCTLPVAMLVPVLKELVAGQFEVGSFWVHAFMSVNMIGGVLFAPLAGALADRMVHRRWFLAGLLGVDGACLLLLQFAPNFPLFMLIRFLEGAVHIAAVSTWMALAADKAPSEQSGRAMGVMAASLLIGTTVGVPLGGLVGQHQPHAVLLVGAVLAGGAALIALLGVSEIPHREVSASMAHGLGLVGQAPRLLVPYAYAFIDRLCAGGIVSTLGLYLAEILELDPRMRGVYLALGLIPFALLSYPAGRLTDRIGRIGPLVGGSIGYGLTFMSFGFLSAQALPAALLLSGVLSAVMFAPNLAMCRDLAPHAHRTSVFAGFNAAGSLGFMLGPLIGGAICQFLGTDVTGYRTALLAIGTTQLLCVAATLPFLHRLARVRSTS